MNMIRKYSLEVGFKKCYLLFIYFEGENKMNPAINVSLYLHDKHVLDGTLKSKSTPNLLTQHHQQHQQQLQHQQQKNQLQQQQTSQALTGSSSSLLTGLLSSNNTNTLTQPTPLITISSPKPPPQPSPLLMRSSKLFSGMTGAQRTTGTQGVNANMFHVTGRKRSISHSEFSDFYDWTNKGLYF